MAKGTPPQPSPRPTVLRRGGRKVSRPKRLLPIRGLLHHRQVSAAARRRIVVVRTARGGVGGIGGGIRTGFGRFAAAGDVIGARHALPGLAGVDRKHGGDRHGHRMADPAETGWAPDAAVVHLTPGTARAGDVCPTSRTWRGWGKRWY